MYDPYPRQGILEMLFLSPRKLKNQPFFAGVLHYEVTIIHSHPFPFPVFHIYSQVQTLGGVEKFWFSKKTKEGKWIKTSATVIVKRQQNNTFRIVRLKNVIAHSLSYQLNCLLTFVGNKLDKKTENISNMYLS